MQLATCFPTHPFVSLPVRNAGARYAFGDFELDEARLELRCAGRAQRVQPKVLRTLLYLVAERERVVTPDELFRAIWPDERVGVASITRAIIGVRRALGEAGDSQQSVRTVRGFGYQFVQPLHLRGALEARWRACSG
ncbi:MAG TPA: winged helix-turn-helix domain-containing protein [Polyangiales bacterium]|nr:winged helix-turn-helix domain-containing protein [Polyangiales bacterium]